MLENLGGPNREFGGTIHGRVGGTMHPSASHVAAHALYLIFALFSPVPRLLTDHQIGLSPGAAVSNQFTNHPADGSSSGGAQPANSLSSCGS